jgi:hypothetical protein
MDLLQRACEVYSTAAVLKPNQPSLLYNWGVALSDIARIILPQDPQEAAACLLAAAGKYEGASKQDTKNAQALNNWALVLQDLAPLRPEAERPGLLRASVARFRRAIRNQPDFDRAIYNLGTVLYSQACIMQEELMQGSSNNSSGSGGNVSATTTTTTTTGGGGGQSPNAAPTTTSITTANNNNNNNKQSSSSLLQKYKTPQAAEKAVRNAFAHAGQYIALAYSLRPDRPVYGESLSAIQRLLPLPYVRCGPLLHPITTDDDGIGEVWVKSWFAIDAKGFRKVRPPVGEQQQGGRGEHQQQQQQQHNQILLSFDDITDAQVCADPSLPSGYALWIGTTTTSNSKNININSMMMIGGVLLVAESSEEAQGWVDAVRLIKEVVRLGNEKVLQEVLGGK